MKSGKKTSAMKSFFTGKSGKKKLLLVVLLFVIAVVGLAALFSSSSTSIVSPFILARVTGLKVTVPSIEEAPSSVASGSTVTLKGKGFTTVQNHVYLGTYRISGLKSSEKGTRITFQVPSKEKLKPASYAVYVRNFRGKSNTVSMTIANTASKTPTISSLSPSSGRVNTTVTISGTKFTATGNQVSFGKETIRNLTSSEGGTKISFKVPQLINSCTNQAPDTFCTQSFIQVEPGRYSVFVQNANGKSNAVSFEVTGSNPTPTSNPQPTTTPTCYNGAPQGQYGCFLLCQSKQTVCIDPPHTYFAQ